MNSADTMTTYTPPISDMLFNLQHLFNDPTSAESSESIAAILGEGGRLASETIAPLNAVGDKVGAQLHDGHVITPPGWGKAYADYAAGGWIGAAIAAEDGGMGLPHAVGNCLQELVQSASMAFALCPMLTQAAIKAISLCGSEAQKQRYLPRLVSGEWTGTMVLTEPNAGSDLSVVRTRAEKATGHYLITGQKIFITYGDHDLTENIVHLVLARTSPLGSGTKGLSLFIVLKRKLNLDGSLGEPNDVRCLSLEHKLGIHGSPTACLAFGDRGDCAGELIGEEGRGLEYMFVMMNEARLGIGIQGLAIAERAYQAAAAYAAERVQGRIQGNKSNHSDPISFHPDVHRMLMVMRTSCEAMRGMALYAGRCMDLAATAQSGEEQSAMQTRLEFLVPIVKGWCTERACEVTSLAVQVHGGMGYVEETGVAQHFRDARITTIYEGTTGIQANDFVSRKILRDRGAAARALLADIRQTLAVLRSTEGDEFSVMHDELLAAVLGCERGVERVLSCNQTLSSAVSVHFLHLFGLTIGAWMLARGALVAAELIREGGGSNSEMLRAKIASAHFFAGQVLPEVRGREAMICDRSGAIFALYPGL